MIKTSRKQKGSVHVFVITVAVVIVVCLLGFVFWQNFIHKKDSSTTEVKASTTAKSTQADPYSGWLTCTDQSDSVSFQYPSTWTLSPDDSGSCSTPSTESDSSELILESPRPQNSQYQYRVQFFNGVMPGSLFSVDSGEVILDVIPLKIATSKSQLYLVAYADASTPTDVEQFALTDTSYTVGQKTAGVKGVTTHTDAAGKTYQMSASMETETGQQYLGQYSLSDYEGQPDYSNVLKLFESIVYS